MTTLTKTIRKINVSDIQDFEYNNKIHNDVSVIKKSIEDCWYITHIEVDENNIVLAWHGRKKALEELWIIETEVMVVNWLKEEQKKKYRLYSNKSQEQAIDDMDNIRLELEEINDEEFSKLYDDEIEEFDPESYKNWIEKKVDKSERMFVKVEVVSEDDAQILSDAVKELGYTTIYITKE